MTLDPYRLTPDGKRYNKLFFPGRIVSTGWSFGYTFKSREDRSQSAINDITSIPPEYMNPYYDPYGNMDPVLRRQYMSQMYYDFSLPWNFGFNYAVNYSISYTNNGTTDNANGSVQLVLKLTRDEDYDVDEKKKVVGILDPGITKVEDFLGIDNLYEPANTALIGYLNNAIKAKELFLRDKDYVVTQGEVLIVDEHTGRILPGRRYNEGLHQAIEAKEGVEVKAENQTFATITLQNYFRIRR